nr:hypothetical protein C5F59_32050 [Streptomyces sp. QL37]
MCTASGAGACAGIRRCTQPVLIGSGSWTGRSGRAPRPGPASAPGAQKDFAARSDSPRSTQNSLPSGSARTAQPAPPDSRRSATRVAPRPSRRSTSSSRELSGRRHRWIRFLTVFGSGTWLKYSTGPSGSSTWVSRSPGPLSGSGGHPVTSLQKRASS